MQRFQTIKGTSNNSNCFCFLDRNGRVKKLDLDPAVVTCSEPHHEDEVRELPCEECQEGVDLHQRSHACVNTNCQSSMERFTQDINRSAEKLGRKIERYQETVRKIRENGAIRSDEINKMRQDVKAFVHSWIEQMQEQEKKIMEDIETMEKSHKEDDDSQISEIEKHLEKMETAMKETEQLARDEAAVEQMKRKEKIVMSNEELIDTELEGETKPRRGYHQFIPNRSIPSSIESGGVGSLLDCIAEGDGLRRGTVDMESTFTISTVAVRGSSKQTHYDPDLSIEVSIQAGIEDISPVIQDNKDGTYSVSFKPHQTGEHSIAITLNGQDTLESPYKVPVRKCVVACEKLIKGTVGLENSFTVSFYNSDDLPVYDPATELKVHIQSPQGPVDSDIKNNEDGTYKVSFVPIQAKENQLVVTVDGQEIPTSPYRVKVRKCVVRGDGLKTGRVGLKSHFSIAFCGEEDEIIYDPTTKLNVKICYSQGPVGTPDIKDDKNGTYNVSFYPILPGSHHCVVTVQTMFSEGQPEVPSESIQQEIPDSPFTVTVEPREFHPVLKFGRKGTNKGELNWPNGVALNAKDEIIVADCGNHRLQVFSSKGEHLRSIGKKGSGEGQFNKPSGVVMDKENNLVVLDKGNGRIQILSETGEFLRSFASRGKEDGQMENPQGLSVDTNGNIIVSDTGNYRVQVFTSEGKWLLSFDCNNARHCVSHGGQYFVSTASDNCVKVFDKSGAFLYKLGARGSSPGAFDWPTGLTIDKAEHLVVCDTSNSRVQVLNMDGTFIGSFGTRGEGHVQFDYPACVAAMGDGKLVVCDARSNTVHIFK